MRGNFLPIMFVAVLALAACDKVVSRTPHPSAAYTEKGTQHCDAGPGYCCEYGMSFDGSFGYTCGMKYACDGRQAVTYKVIPETIKYESGKTTKSKNYEVVSVDGPCQD